MEHSLAQRKLRMSHLGADRLSVANVDGRLAPDRAARALLYDLQNSGFVLEIEERQEAGEAHLVDVAAQRSPCRTPPGLFSGTTKEPANAGGDLVARRVLGDVIVDPEAIAEQALLVSREARQEDQRHVRDLLSRADHPQEGPAVHRRHLR